MADEGLVALDDPAKLYLPEGIQLPVRGRAITLVDLATQTSG
jgi:CubicO group peptidase (beta-lactamase class C family)